MSGQALRDEGIALAEAHANEVHEDWSERAYGFLVQVSKIASDFTCEDVREFAERNGLPKPPTARAWGGVMRRAAFAQVIRQTGQYRPIKDPTNHHRPVAVWESMKGEQTCD